MEMMQKISAYEVQSANVKVTNDAEYQMAADSLVAVADVGKSLENMRVRIVAYPNTFVKRKRYIFLFRRHNTGPNRCLAPDNSINKYWSGSWACTVAMALSNFSCLI